MMTGRVCRPLPKFSPLTQQLSAKRSFLCRHNAGNGPRPFRDRLLNNSSGIQSPFRVVSVMSSLSQSVKSQKQENQQRRKENVIKFRHYDRQAYRSQRNRQDRGGATNGCDNCPEHACLKTLVPLPGPVIVIHISLLWIRFQESFRRARAREKSGPLHGLNHCRDINRLRIIGNSGGFFGETHLCLFHSL